MLKDLLYIGAGGLLTIQDRVRKELNALEERGKITKEDSDAFIDKLYDRAKAEHDKNMEYFREVVGELNLATKDDIEALKEKIESLEKQLNEKK
ncbi:MAG: hypothetical protein GX282_03035 [Campylobacteraceae bacterium]|nr:hypothetical protein [Campylobacteraceae bacterium]